MGWEVVIKVEPIAPLYSNPWELLLRLLILYCYARRRGLVVSEIHDTCELLINGST